MGFFRDFDDMVRFIGRTRSLLEVNPSIRKPTQTQVRVGMELYVLLLMGLVGILLSIFDYPLFSEEIMTTLFVLGMVGVGLGLVFLFPLVKTYYRCAQTWMVYQTFAGHYVTYMEGLDKAQEHLEEVWGLTHPGHAWKEKTGMGDEVVLRGMENFVLLIAVIEGKKMENVEVRLREIKERMATGGMNVGIMHSISERTKVGLTGVLVLTTILGFVGGYFIGNILLGIIMLLLFFAFNLFFLVYMDMGKTVYYTLLYLSVEKYGTIVPEYAREVSAYLEHFHVDKTSVKKAREMHSPIREIQMEKHSSRVTSTIPTSNTFQVASTPAPSKTVTPTPKPKPIVQPLPMEKSPGKPKLIPTDVELVKLAQQVAVLIPHVKRYKSQGHTKEQIVRFLQQNGWGKMVIETAWEEVEGTK